MRNTDFVMRRLNNIERRIMLVIISLFAKAASEKYVIMKNIDFVINRLRNVDPRKSCAMVRTGGRGFMLLIFVLSAQEASEN